MRTVSGQMGIGNPPGRSGVSASRAFGPRRVTLWQVGSESSRWNAQQTGVPRAWTLLSRGSGFEGRIGCLRLTPARGGVTATRSAARRWVMGEAPRRRGTAEEGAIRTIACPRSRPVMAGLPRGPPGQAEEAVAMTTAVEGKGARPAWYDQRTFRDEAEVMLMFRSRRRVRVQIRRVASVEGNGCAMVEFGVEERDWGGDNGEGKTSSAKVRGLDWFSLQRRNWRGGAGGECTSGAGWSAAVHCQACGWQPAQVQTAGGCRWARLCLHVD